MADISCHVHGVKAALWNGFQCRALHRIRRSLSFALSFAPSMRILLFSLRGVILLEYFHHALFHTAGWPFGPIHPASCPPALYGHGAWAVTGKRPSMLFKTQNTAFFPLAPYLQPFPVHACGGRAFLEANKRRGGVIRAPTMGWRRRLHGPRVSGSPLPSATSGCEFAPH